MSWKLQIYAMCDMPLARDVIGHYLEELQGGQNAADPLAITKTGLGEGDCIDAKSGT